MEDLIQQAFLGEDILESHAAKGHYDLVGPSKEISLPQAWENMLKPDLKIAIHMGPLSELPAAVSATPPLGSPLPIKLPTLLPQILPIVAAILDSQVK